MTAKTQKNETATLERMTLRQLQAHLRKLTGKATKAKSRANLIKRCAAAVEARTPNPIKAKPHKTRLQLEVGTVLTRTHQGKDISVTVTADGFEWGGSTYASLSSLAKAITGYHISGPAFFKLPSE